MKYCPRCNNKIKISYSKPIYTLHCSNCNITTEFEHRKFNLDSQNEAYEKFVKKFKSIRKEDMVKKNTNGNSLEEKLLLKKNEILSEKKSIHEFLPKNTNPNQSEEFPKILDFIEESIKKGEKYIIVNAPTGIGKSHIAATVSKYLKEGIILTDQISLQSQYIQTFPWMNHVKGMSNFLCPELDWSEKANFGNCENCVFRCSINDFEINNEGTDEEKISVIKNSRFGEDIDIEILKNEKILEIIPDEERDVPAINFLTEEEQNEEDGMIERFAIKYNDDYFFVLPEDKIPKESIVLRNGEQLITRSNEICPYYHQRIMGEKGNFSVYNYSMYIATMLGKSTDSENTRPRNILICDEAHKLDNHLQAEGAVKMNLKSIESILGLEIIQELVTKTVQRDFSGLLTKLELVKNDLELKQNEIRNHKECIKFLDSKFHIDYHRSNYCKKHKRISPKCINCKKLKSDKEKGEFLRCKSHSLKNIIPCKEEHDEYSNQYLKKIREVRNNLNSSLQIIKKIQSKYHDDGKNFVMTFDQYKKEIILQPVRVSETAEKLFSNFNYVLFLSSTIHEKVFTEDLGIKDYAFKSFPNPIKKSNRVIKMWGGTTLTKWDKSKIEQQYESIAQKIIKIINNYSDERGLILVNSYPDMKGLMKYLDQVRSRLTFNENKIDEESLENSNSELLKKHKDKQNSVLFSPSMWEGVDLKNDLGSFCIIATAPFMPSTETSNPYCFAKNRLRNDQEWMNMKNAFKFVQGVGRCVRGIDDSATIYVLDDGCNKLKGWLEQYQKTDKNAGWFTDSFEPFLAS